MKIKEIMSVDVVTIPMDAQLKAVKEIFDRVSFHHILVVEANALCGVISDRDLLKALSPNIGTASETIKDTATLNKRVHQIVTKKAITLKENAGIYDAIAVFNQYNISCIPIIDDFQKPVGVLSWRDILKVIEQKKQAQVAKQNEEKNRQ